MSIQWLLYYNKGAVDSYVKSLRTTTVNGRLDNHLKDTSFVREKLILLWIRLYS